LARQPGLQNAPPRAAEDRNGRLIYRFVQAVRSRGEGLPAGTLLGIVSVKYSAPRARVDLVENLGMVLMAGALAGILAILVFYIITQKLILMPVRELRAVADEVSSGNHDVRSRVATGD